MITENVVIKRHYSWIDIERPLKVDYEFLKEEFKLPQLLVQDCIKPGHLPKYEHMEEGHFLLSRAFDPASDMDDITVPGLTNKLGIFIMKERIITVHNVELNFLRKFADLNRDNFPDTLPGMAHQMMRAIILTYEEPIMKLQNNYEDFEHEVLSRSTEFLSTNRVYHFRRQIFVLKSMLKQNQIALFHCKEFWGSHNSLLQDLREDIDQMYFRLDDLSHNFDQLFALYLSINEQRSNEVMKVLTIFATILLPLTFISSFYGMNFEHLPGIHTTFGLGATILLMVFFTFIAIWYFNRRGWFKPRTKSY